MIDVNINFVGMSSDDYSDYVCMYKPYEIYRCKFVEGLSDDCCYSDLISRAFVEYIQQCKQYTYSVEEFNEYSLHYVKYGKYLIGCPAGKLIKEIRKELEIDDLIVEIFVLGGGASIQCHGYSFVIHSNEAIHKHSPHVHVKRDGYSVRYSLENFERYDRDVCSREYIRDEKRIIIPFLKKNYSFFRDCWEKAQMGYEMPVIDELGRQYCEENIH